MSIKENNLEQMIKKLAEENNASEEMVIEALKTWIEKYDKMKMRCYNI